jgi:hypothetical protein
MSTPLWESRLEMGAGTVGAGLADAPMAAAARRMAVLEVFILRFENRGLESNREGNVGGKTR